MKKIMDKLFNVDKKTLLFLLIICFIGLLTGSLFMTVLKNSDKELITETVNGFITNISSTNSNKMFIESLIINLLLIIFIWVLGISVIGIPIVIVFIFIKSFLLSFSLSSFIANFKLKGLVLGIIYNFPHNFINLLLFLYLGVYSIRLSTIILNSVIKRKTIDFKIIMNRYLMVFIFSFVAIIFLSLFEAFATPYLLKIISNVL